MQLGASNSKLHYKWRALPMRALATAMRLALWQQRDLQRSQRRAAAIRLGFSSISGSRAQLSGSRWVFFAHCPDSGRFTQRLKPATAALTLPALELNAKSALQAHGPVQSDRATRHGLLHLAACRLPQAWAVI